MSRAGVYDFGAAFPFFGLRFMSEFIAALQALI
jgi:hypothetical protein